MAIDDFFPCPICKGTCVLNSGDYEGACGACEGTGDGREYNRRKKQVEYYHLKQQIKRDHRALSDKIVQLLTWAYARKYKFTIQAQNNTIQMEDGTEFKSTAILVELFDTENDKIWHGSNTSMNDALEDLADSVAHFIQ